MKLIMKGIKTTMLTVEVQVKCVSLVSCRIAPGDKARSDDMSMSDIDLL